MKTNRNLRGCAALIRAVRTFADAGGGITEYYWFSPGAEAISGFGAFFAFREMCMIEYILRIE